MVYLWGMDKPKESKETLVDNLLRHAKEVLYHDGGDDADGWELDFLLRNRFRKELGLKMLTRDQAKQAFQA